MTATSCYGSLVADEPDRELLAGAGREVRESLLGRFAADDGVWSEAGR